MRVKPFPNLNLQSQAMTMMIIKSSSKWEHDLCFTQKVSVQNKFEMTQWEFFLPILHIYRLMSQFYWLTWNLVYLFALNINKINPIFISNIYVHLPALIALLWPNRIQQNTVPIRKDLASILHSYSRNLKLLTALKLISFVSIGHEMSHWDFLG